MDKGPAVVKFDGSQVSNQQDTENLRCSGFLPNPTGKALRFDMSDLNANCGTGVDVVVAGGFQQTSIWRQVVSASGKATLTCHD